MTQLNSANFVYLTEYYGSIPLPLGLMGRYGGLSTLCRNCGFASQQSVLKTFLGSGYLPFKDGLV